MDLTTKTIMVTGGAGFLGQHVVRSLKERGCEQIIVPRRGTHDLTHEAAVERLYAEARPDIVIHLAAVVGGIGANLANAGRFVYDNLVMGVMTMEYARRSGVAKFVGVGTI